MSGFKKAWYIITIAISFFGVPTLAQGIDLGGGRVDSAANQAGYAPATQTTFSENVGKAIRILLSLLGVIFTVLIIYAGYLWMTARGNDEVIAKSKSIISSSIIGLIILLMAYSITDFVVSRLLENSINTSSTPQ